MLYATIAPLWIGLITFENTCSLSAFLIKLFTPDCESQDDTCILGPTLENDNK